MAFGDKGQFFVDFEWIWGACLGSLWKHWGPLFCDKRVRTLRIEVFFGCLFKVTFFDDFRSDSRVPGTLKTSIWRERGCKNQFFTEVGILMILGSVLEVIWKQKEVWDLILRGCW